MQTEVKGFSEQPSLTIDGQVNWSLLAGDRAAVRRAKRSVRLVQTGRRTYFETLRNKLDWRGQPRYVG
jgi:NAD kinase